MMISDMFYLVGWSSVLIFKNHFLQRDEIFSSVVILYQTNDDRKIYVI